MKILQSIQSYNRTFIFACSVCLITSLFPSVSQADKIDTLLACQPITPTIQQRGLLFILDDSSSMTSEMDSNEVNPDDATADPVTTRWDALVDAFHDIVLKIGENVPVGVMFFNQSPMGAYVAYPVQDIDSAPVGPLYNIPDNTPTSTVRELLPRMVTFNVWDPGTPSQGALEEAIRYLRGDKVFYGAQRAFNVPDHGYSRYQWGERDPDDAYGTDVWTNCDFLSHPYSYTLDAGSSVSPSNCTWSLDYSTCADEKIVGSATYISPYTALGPGDSHIEIIFMTDGGPAGINDIAAASSLIGVADCVTPGEEFNSSMDDRCLRKLAAHIGQTADHNPLLPGSQTASLSIIAVRDNTKYETLFQDLTSPSTGNGSYFWVNTHEKFIDAYTVASQAVIPQVPPEMKKPQVMSAPAVSFNYENGTHRQEIFFPVQEPSYLENQELGNLKAYKIELDPPEIVDDNGNPVLDETDGEIDENSKSTWTVGAGNDGDDATEGGADDHVPPYWARKVYSDMFSAEVLTHSKNRFSIWNPYITIDMFNNAPPLSAYWTNQPPIDPDADDYYDATAYFPRTYQAVQKYIRWTNRKIGAPLNSEPATYQSGSLTGGSHKRTIFMGTDKGLFHAFDAETGKERFAYLPYELLPTVAHKFHGKRDPILGKRYGVDGSPVVVIDNKAPFDSISGGDQAVVVFGLRRGGHNYYALDVLNPDQPELAWKIIGGIPGDPFEKMAQTWSKPIEANIKTDAANPPRKVLVVGGGYNAAVQDFANKRETDTMGNAIYIIDPFTGQLLWMASNNNLKTGALGSGLQVNEMDYSIPAQVSVVDNDGDGLSDMMIVGDMGGQILRFDIINADASTSFEIKGGRVAEYAKNGPPWHRRFFQKIDVSHGIVQGKRKVALGVGSGSVDRPFRVDLNNAFFMTFLDSPFAPPAFYTTLKQNDLKDRTNTFMGGDDEDGWFITLNQHPGEKLLTSSITTNGVINFATYLPPTPGPGCSAQLTTRQWVTDIVTGKATKYYGADPDPLTSRSVISKSASAAMVMPKLLVTELGPMIITGEEHLYKGKDIGFPGLETTLNKWEKSQ